MSESDILRRTRKADEDGVHKDWWTHLREVFELSGDCVGYDCMAVDSLSSDPHDMANYQPDLGGTAD